MATHPSTEKGCRQPLTRPLACETVADAVAIADLQLSPDGRRVAYAATRATTEKAAPPVGTLWLVDADGRPAKRISAPGMNDSHPRWAPDGRRIAFLSTRDGCTTTQIYLVDLDRDGKAAQLTDLARPVLAFEWSPDGQLIAFTAAGQDDASGADGDEIVVDDRLEWNALYAIRLSGDDPPEPRQISPAGIHVGGYGLSWTPDGTSIMTTTARSSKANDLITPRLVAISLQGEIRHVASFQGAELPGFAPRVSPDGSMVAINATVGGVPALYSLQVVPVAGGDLRPIAPSFTGTFATFAWLPDGDTLLATTHEGQSGRLVTVSVSTGKVTDALPAPDRPFGLIPAQNPYLSLSPDGSRVAFGGVGDASCGDVYVADLGQAPVRLTDLNPWTGEYEFGEVREFSWTSFDGLEIQGLLMLPVGYCEGARYPTLLEIHGGPPSLWSRGLYVDLWGDLLAQRGYAVLRPNPRGSAGRGAAFLRGVPGSLGEPDFADVMAGVDKLVELGIADPDRLVVGGHSYGGTLTNWAITHTDRFRAAVSMSGMCNFVSFQGTTDIRGAFDAYLGRVDVDPDNHWKCSPIRYIASATTPTLILFGERDERVPLSQGHELYEGLKSRGIDTKFVIYPREGHIIAERQHRIDLLNRTIAWYDDHLGRA